MDKNVECLVQKVDNGTSRRIFAKYFETFGLEMKNFERKFGE